jgi:hypothetical protein
VVDDHVDVGERVQGTENVLPLVGGHPDLDRQVVERFDHADAPDRRTGRRAQRHVVAGGGEPRCLHRDHPLDAAVGRRRDGNPGWGHEADAHGSSSV